MLGRFMDICLDLAMDRQILIGGSDTEYLAWVQLNAQGFRGN